MKEARRQSIVKARDALLRVSNSDAVKQARAAVRELKAKGYDTGQFGSL